MLLILAQSTRAWLLQKASYVAISLRRSRSYCCLLRPSCSLECLLLSTLPLLVPAVRAWVAEDGRTGESTSEKLRRLVRLAFGVRGPEGENEEGVVGVRDSPAPVAVEDSRPCMLDPLVARERMTGTSNLRVIWLLALGRVAAARAREAAVGLLNLLCPATGVKACNLALAATGDGEVSSRAVLGEALPPACLETTRFEEAEGSGDSDAEGRTRLANFAAAAPCLRTTCCVIGEGEERRTLAAFRGVAGSEDSPTKGSTSKAGRGSSPVYMKLVNWYTFSYQID